MNTKNIDTLSTAPISFDDDINHDFLLPYKYLDTLRNLYDIHMQNFILSGEFSHYSRANKLKGIIKSIVLKKPV